MPSTDKEANARYQRKWYARNQKLQRRRVEERRNSIRVWLREYKNTLFCVKCGQNHPATIDFHHTDPAEKTTNIAVAIHCGWSLKRLKEELEKCIALCSNCHRILHWDEKRFNS